MDVHKFWKSSPTSQRLGQCETEANRVMRHEEQLMSMFFFEAAGALFAAVRAEWTLEVSI